MAKKSRDLTSNELHLMEVLKKIGYIGKPSLASLERYVEENKIEIRRIEEVEEGKYPTQKAIVLSYYLSEFRSQEVTKDTYSFPSDFEINDKNIESSLSKACFRITKILGKREKFKLYKENIKRSNFNLYIIFVLQDNSRLGNHFKIRHNDRNLKYIGSVYVDKKDKKLKTINISYKISPLFLTLLQDELKEVLISQDDFVVCSWKDMRKSIFKKNAKYEIEEISLNKTDFNVGDKITITSNKGDVKEYVYSLLNQQYSMILKQENFDISYIDNLNVRLRGRKTNFIDFEQLDDGSIKVSNKSKTKDLELIKELERNKFFVDKKVIDPVRIPKEKIMQQIIIRGFLPKNEMDVEVYRDVLEELDAKQIIKAIKEKYVYRCTRSKKCFAGAAFTSKRCPICSKEDRSKRFTKGIVFELNERKIRDAVKEIARKNKIKYRYLKPIFYNDKYNLIKLSIPGFNDVNLYFNNRGLYKDVIKDFKMCPRPLLCVNFKGEMKGTLEFMHQVDAAEFINKLFFSKSDAAFIKYLKDEILKDPKLDEGREGAFKESLANVKELKKNNNFAKPNIGNKFEWIVSNIFNYIFKLSDKWGGPSLPDGIVGLSQRKDKKFIFWDSKCYNISKLSNYAKKKDKGVVKDVQYVLQSIKQENTYEEGKILYYLFVTSNTSRDDFDIVRKEIDKVIEKNRLVKKKGRKRRVKNRYYDRLKEVKFCCINIDQLILLAEFFNKKQKRDSVLRNWKGFESAIEEILSIRDGYIENSDIKRLLTPLSKGEEFMPNRKTHQRQGITLKQ